MADKRITDLSAVTTLADDDLLLVSDTSSSETKKATFLNFKNSIASGTGSLTDIVQDVTPQLGGHLDVNGKTITIVLVATAPASFKINIDTNSTFINKDSHPIISIPAVGDSATVVWSGSAWFLTSLVGTAATAAS